MYPFGNTNASMVAADIYKECYPKIEVEAYGIELQLYEDESKQQFVIVNMTDDVRKKYMKEAINLMLEIYGKCYVYDDVIRIEKTIKRKRCNWKMLPPGEMPSRHVEKQLKSMNQKTDTYDIARLNYMEMYNATTMVEGVNGFKGYYAYLYDNYCVLESAFYGNATYIIPNTINHGIYISCSKPLFFRCPCNRHIGFLKIFDKFCNHSFTLFCIHIQLTQSPVLWFAF